MKENKKYEICISFSIKKGGPEAGFHIKAGKLTLVNCIYLYAEGVFQWSVVFLSQSLPVINLISIMIGDCCFDF